MAHAKASEVPAFAFPPRCAHTAPETRERCGAEATHWLVSDDGLAITWRCWEHASAVLEEYHRVGAASPADPLLAPLARWSLTPVRVQEIHEVGA